MSILEMAENSPLIEADLNDRFALSRLELELSLEVGENDVPTESKAIEDFVRGAVEKTGDDLLFFLPTAEDGDPSAVIRLKEGEEMRLVSVMRFDDGFVVIDEDEIAENTVQFARTMIDVLERLGSDEKVVAPLAECH